MMFKNFHAFIYSEKMRENCPSINFFENVNVNVCILRYCRMGVEDPGLPALYDMKVDK